MTEYVAEVWVDPSWYRTQNPPDALPTLTRPRIVRLNTGGPNSIGRAITKPAIDCGLDSGVSRSHAELTFDGNNWVIVDQGSANGTYVTPATESLPKQPITGPTPVAPEHRIYLGCWTRLVVRPATPTELS